jgi:hypothetical protein
MFIRVQLPLAMGDDSEPEPDITVVGGSIRDYRDAHPESAVLVIEISDSTLAFDRQVKGSLYARARALPTIGSLISSTRSWRRIATHKRIRRRGSDGPTLNRNASPVPNLLHRRSAE